MPRSTEKIIRTLSRNEKLEFILQCKVPDVFPDDLAEIELELHRGSSLEDAIQRLMVIEQILEPERAAYESCLHEAWELRTNLLQTDQIDAVYNDIKRDREEKQRLVRADDERVLIAGAQAKFEDWAQRASWTIDESTALFLGLEPKAISPKAIKTLSNSGLAAKFQYIRDLIARATELSEIGTAAKRVRPAALLGWAKKHGVEYPTELERAIQRKQRIPATTSFKQMEEEEEINPRVLQSYYKIILGVAISKYGFDPKYDPESDESNRSPAFADISRDLHASGVGLSLKPIRKHIVEALKHAKAVGWKLKKPPSKPSA